MADARPAGPDRTAFERLVATVGRRHSLDLIAPVDPRRWNDPADGNLSYACQIEGQRGWSAVLHRRRLPSEAKAGNIRVNLGFDPEGQPTDEMAAAVDRMATMISALRRRERMIEASGHDVTLPPAWSVKADPLIMSFLKMADVDVEEMTRGLKPGIDPLRRVLAREGSRGFKVRMDMHVHRGEMRGTMSLHKRMEDRRIREVVRLKTGRRLILGISDYVAPATVLAILAGTPLGSVLNSEAVSGSENRTILEAGQDDGSLLTLALAQRGDWLSDAPDGIARDWDIR